MIMANGEPDLNAHVALGDSKPRVGCRPIRESDLDGIVALLTRGFRERTAEYWRTGLARHAARPRPTGFPDFGFVMEADGRPVGVVLTLYTAAVEPDGRSVVRCNLSSWYVEPAFRAFAALLDNVAIRRREVTYFNISPAPKTWTMHEARGFRRYATGQIVALPLLNRPVRGVVVRTVGPDDPLDDLPEGERRLVADHASYGCTCLVARDGRGSHPLIFVRRPVDALLYRIGWSPLSYLHLLWCRAPADLPGVAHAVGRRLLARHGLPWFMIDANASIPGLAGVFRPGWGTKFQRGPGPLRPGDLAYTELALFGP